MEIRKITYAAKLSLRDGSSLEIPGVYDPFQTSHQLVHQAQFVEFRSADDDVLGLVASSEIVSLLWLREPKTVAHGGEQRDLAEESEWRTMLRDAKLRLHEVGG